MKRLILSISVALFAAACGSAQNTSVNQNVGSSVYSAQLAVDEASRNYEDLYRDGKEDISRLKREVNRINDEISRLRKDRKDVNENVKAFKDVLKIRKDALKLQKKAGADKDQLDLLKNDIKASERQYKDAKATLKRLDNRIND